VIPGSAGHVYCTNFGECSCPDNQHRGVECKRITAVKLHVAKAADYHAIFGSGE